MPPPSSVEAPKKKHRAARIIRPVAINGFILLSMILVADWFHGRSMLQTANTGPTFELHAVLSQKPTTIPATDKPTLLYFSAPWCGVCGVTGENIERMKRWLGDEVLVREISLAFSNHEELLAYSKSHGNRDFLVGNDKIMQQYQVSSFPSFYFLQSGGKVRYTTAGYTSTLGLYIRALYYL